MTPATKRASRYDAIHVPKKFEVRKQLHALRQRIAEHLGVPEKRISLYGSMMFAVERANAEMPNTDGIEMAFKVGNGAK